jgi:hypothetical protein
MGLEFILFVFILIFSYILVLKRFDLALYVLLVLSVLMHKELFSFYKWDLLPVRAFMIALLIAGVTQFYLWFIKKGSIKQLLEYLKQPFILLLVLLWLVRGVSIVFSKNLQSSLFLFGFFSTVVVLGIYLYFFLRDDPKKDFKIS